MGFGANFMFTIMPFIVGIIFCFVIGMFIVHGVRSARQWSRNNDSPVLTVTAKVVAKRLDVRHHNHTGDNMHNAHSSTTYFATFEVESGDRMELRIPNNEYGMLVEGDNGRLTFQGTRYKGFERG